MVTGLFPYGGFYNVKLLSKIRVGDAVVDWVKLPNKRVLSFDVNYDGVLGWLYWLNVYES